MADRITETLNLRRVMVTGATSQIGVFAIPRLLNAGFHVVAVSRQPRPHFMPQSEQLDWLSVDQAVRDQVSPTPSSKLCQYLLSAGPMSLALQVLGSSKHFKQAVIFSSSSVIIKRDSPDLAERTLIQNMRMQEVELTTIAKQQNINMVVFRPTLIYGCGLDKNISRLAALIKRYGAMPVNGKGSGLRQPVHADDLAQVAVNALLFKQEMPEKMLLTGGSTLSYVDMVEAIFAALNKPVRILNLPQWLLIPVIRILKQLGLVNGISVALVKRQLQDQAFDNLPAQQLLDYHPRPFAPTKKDFELPENRQQSSN